MTTADTTFELTCQETFHCATFQAMASPCELLFDTEDAALVSALAAGAVAEVRRIENKFSRYIEGNLCAAINNAQGAQVPVDAECYRLLTFAQACYELSDGFFDLTSGVLRRVWSFDGGKCIPTAEQVQAVLPLVGWEKVRYNENTLQMPAGMEVDFGGIAKEYAVNAAAECCRIKAPELSVLVNLGGDIQVTCPRKNDRVWQVGIENGNQVLPIRKGALATSGDAKRFLLSGGKRYSHILNPKTGWPVDHAPSSVTVHAPLCMQAGCMATLALLQGEQAEHFLENQGVPYWCQWP